MFSTLRITAVSALLAALLPSTTMAQLHSACNPFRGDKNCPADPAFGTEHDFTFNQSQPAGIFKNEAGYPQFSPDKYGAFTINKQGESVTYVTNFYFFFGRTEVHMKTAPGQGIISSIVWMSDVLDEVDWEFKGGDDKYVMTNYFGKGEPDNSNGGNFTIDGSLQNEWHNYTNVWTKDKLEWHFDGKLVRTLLPKDANNTRNFPQTPMRLSLGIWSGGDVKMNAPGTVAWAGGATDFSKAPFTMGVKSARIEDYSQGKEYTYTDGSGSWQSIKITEGNSTAVENLNVTPPKTTAEKWNELPSGTKTGIYAAAGGVGGLAFIALVWFCIRSRSRGKREAAAAAAKDEQERMEMERWRAEGKNPDALAFDGADAATAAKGSSVAAQYSVPRGPDYSPPGSSAGPPTGEWDPTSSGGGGGGVPAAGYAPGGPLRQQSFGSNHGSFSPARSQSPGQAPNFPLPTSPIQRMGSPASQGQPGRMYSPGPGAPPRSMTTSPGGQHGYQGIPARSQTASPGHFGAPQNGGYPYRG